MPNDSGICMAFVGSLVPDDPGFQNPAFNRAGHMFQKELIRGLAHAGLAPAAVYAVEPTPSFPRNRRLIVRGRTVMVGDLRVQLLPFVNVQPLKSITAGVSTFVALLRWGWRHRGARRLIHCVNLSVPPAPSILLAARILGAKATVSVLDVPEPGQFVPNRFFTRLDFWMHKRAIPRFDGHMVAAQAIADDFAPGRVVFRLEGGVRPEDFAAPVVARPPRADGQPFRAVVSGTLGEFNGVILAMDAFERLPDGFELVIAGTGPLEPEVRARARRDPKIVFKGFMTFSDVLDLYRSADLLLNVRLTQSMNTRHFYPSKMMEFMASGTPVLSTCTGHTEEEFGDFVYLLRQETPDALADLIAHIAAADPDERAGMGSRAREYTLVNKTWVLQTERLLQYFRRQVFGAAT